VRGRTVVLSLVFHAGLAVSLLGAATHRAARRPTAVALTETKKKDKEKPKPPKPPPFHPVARAPIERKVAVLPKSDAPIPAATTAPRAVVATALTMTNDGDPGGIALPSRNPVTAAPTRVASAVTESRRQRMREALGPGADGDAPCAEEATRPEPVFKQEIEYTAQARAEGVEGKLKLRLTVGVDGSVVRVDVVESVSPEMDAAAIAAAKQWRFKPAMACGRPIAGGTYVLARRFELGD
jgi:periplasmic protein TonB